MPDTVLRLLQQEEGFVSGQKISRALGITRAAVWKKISLLRKRGCTIESAVSRGYRLVRTPDLFAESLRDEFAGGFWKEILVYDVLDSTNDVAMDLAKQRRPGTSVAVIADAQRNGRGRLGRTWISPPGKNIHLSLLIWPDLLPRDAPLLTFLSAVACARALRSVCRIPVSIKWPNDLMVDGLKLGGILTEVRADPDRILYAVIGIGINVNMRKADFPPALRKLSTSALLETGRESSRNSLISGILHEVEEWLSVVQHTGKEALLASWRELSSTLGHGVRVVTGTETLSGKAVDIDENGFLILRTDDGSLRKISAGDVTMLRRT